MQLHKWGVYALLVVGYLSCAAPLQEVVASQGSSANAESSYCNNIYLYCLSYPTTFTAVELVENPDDGGADLQFAQDLRLMITARNDVMNIPFEQLYQEEMQQLQKEYSQIKEIGSVTYGTEFYEMEVHTPARKMFVKRYRLADNLITVRMTAPLDYVTGAWQEMTGGVTVSRK